MGKKKAKERVKAAGGEEAVIELALALIQAARIGAVGCARLLLEAMANVDRRSRTTPTKTTCPSTATARRPSERRETTGTLTLCA